MNFFDLHCDTAGECCKAGKPLYDNDMHISVRKGKCLDKWAQVFAIWIADELRGDAASDYFDAAYAYFKEQIRQNALHISHCVTGADIADANAHGRCAAILSIEGGAAVRGSLERADEIFDCGVKLMTLTWNGANEIASGAMVPDGGGLTDFGRKLVRRMNERKIIVDVSHLNRRGFYDVESVSDAPFIASHSDSNAVLEGRTPGKDKDMAIRRNLDDDQIRVIIDRVGLIGINFCGSFLGDPGKDGIEAVYAHISHILDLGGENVLAMGSDFDGCDINPEMSGIERIPRLYDSLCAMGIPAPALDKIFYTNAYSFFTKGEV